MAMKPQAKAARKGVRERARRLELVERVVGVKNGHLCEHYWDRAVDIFVSTGEVTSYLHSHVRDAYEAETLYDASTGTRTFRAANQVKFLVSRGVPSEWAVAHHESQQL